VEPQEAVRAMRAPDVRRRRAPQMPVLPQRQPLAYGQDNRMATRVSREEKGMHDLADRIRERTDAMTLDQLVAIRTTARPAWLRREVGTDSREAREVLSREMARRFGLAARARR